MIHRRRPEKLDGPGQSEQREKTDLAQVDAKLTEVDREDVVEETEGEALRKIKNTHPEHF